MSNKTLRKVLRDRLRDAAGIVVAESKAIAEQNTCAESGDMIASIRPFAAGASGRRSGSAGVQVTAVHGGYAYPRRLEYEGRAGGGVWPARVRESRHRSEGRRDRRRSRSCARRRRARVRRKRMSRKITASEIFDTVEIDLWGNAYTLRDLTRTVSEQVDQARKAALELDEESSSPIRPPRR
jgi:hypothetical protein